MPDTKYTSSPCITFPDIEAAAGRLRDVAVLTPILESPALNDHIGGRILIKPESLQRTGSFKFRGAYNRLVQLSDAERRAGVVAWSSGNHAQGVAAAARMLNIPAAIVMPEDAPAVKLRNTRAHGAEVILYDRYTESREEIAGELARQRGAVLVPSFEDPHIMAGQGTAGLEFARQAEALGAGMDTLLVGISGGGLMAGVATAFAHVSPPTALYCVEPAGFDDHARFLATGKRSRNVPEARSICDALQAPEPGELTYAINSRYLAGGLVVSDDEVREAIRYAFSTLKLVVEPGGAVGLAAVLAGKIPCSGQTTGIVLSGGNIDAAVFAEIVY